MSAWNIPFSNFAEGDSGVPMPGQATAEWAAIVEAERNKPKRKLASKPISEIMAELMEIGTDKSNKPSDRIDAIRLAFEMSIALRDVGINPLAAD